MSTDIRQGVWSIIVAGGSGTRYGAVKQFADLGGRRVIDWAVRAAASVSEGVVVVVPEPAIEHESAQPSVAAAVQGGATRSESVRCGLAEVPESASVVLVHDAARPLASPELFRQVLAPLETGADAAIPVVAVADSLRTVDGEVVDREKLVAVQTPQAFTAKVLREAHREDPVATDDASLVSAAGRTVAHVDGEVTNIKITSHSDILVAEALLRR